MSRSFQLTDEQVRTFHEDGCLLVPKLLDGEEVQLLYRIGTADKALAEEAWSMTDQDGGVSRITLRHVLGQDDVYSTIVRCPRVAGAMAQLLDDEVYHWHHKMMQKEPEVGGAWEWHQDYGYWYGDSCLFPDMASCMIAVDRATKENGCLQVIRGSHKLGRIEHGRTGGQVGADPKRVEKILDRMERIYVELEPGDAFYFHCNALHRSEANRSPHPRWSFICCYNTRHNDPFDPDAELMHVVHYQKLDLVDDAEVKETGRRQWEKLQAGVPEDQTRNAP